MQFHETECLYRWPGDIPGNQWLLVPVNTDVIQVGIKRVKTSALPQYPQGPTKEASSKALGVSEGTLRSGHSEVGVKEE